MPKEKKPFNQKFKEENGKWVENPGWQTTNDEKFPKNPATGEIEPWADSLRIWMFEMRQWAQTVTDDLGSDGQVAQLRQQVGGLAEELREISAAQSTLRSELQALKAEKSVIPPGPN